MRCILNAGVLLFCLSGMFLSPTIGFSAENDDKLCIESLTGCTAAAGTLAKGIVGQLEACKPLRECKKECRTEKRECKKDARSEKKNCKQDCKDRFGKGKEYRKCKKSCREDKRDTKKECRTEKRECKDNCKETFKTPECKKARLAVLGSSVATIPACVTFAACVAGGKKEGTQ